MHGGQRAVEPRDMFSARHHCFFVIVIPAVLSLATARVRFNSEWILNGTLVDQTSSTLEGPSLESYGYGAHAGGLGARELVEHDCA